MICQQCGTANDTSAKFCASCGSALRQNESATRAEEKFSEHSEEFYKAAIGPKNQSYYLRIFQRFDNAGKSGPSWHWPAFFITFFWLLYRKMWRNAFIYFFLPYIALAVLGVVVAASGESGDAVVGFGYILILAGIFLLPPIYANALYYQHCNKKIREATASSFDEQRKLGELSERGGTSAAGLIIVFIFVVIPTVGIMASVAIPTYHDYVLRARILEATYVGYSAADSVTRYYSVHEQIPSSLEAAGFSERLPSSVKHIAVDRQNGTVSITIAAAPFEGKDLLLVPVLDENSQVTWQCMSQDIPEVYLPSQCRQQ